jgi:hypothetical protein
MLGAGAGHMGLGFMLFSCIRTLVPHVLFVPHVLEQHIPSLDQCWFHIGIRPAPLVSTLNPGLVTTLPELVI